MMPPRVLLVSGIVSLTLLHVVGGVFPLIPGVRGKVHKDQSEHQVELWGCMVQRGEGRGGGGEVGKKAQ